MTSSFRRSVAADTKKKAGKGGKAWYDKYRLPKEQPGTPLIVINGKHVDPSASPEQQMVDPTTGQAMPVINPYFKLRVHKRVLNKNRPDEWFADDVCSQGHNQYAPQPCVGCFAIDSGDKSVSVADAFAFTIVHLAYYHGHPLLDRDKGGIVMKNDNSGPVMIQTECSGRTCNFCRVLSGQPPLPPLQGQTAWPGFDPRSLTTTFGKRRYLELGSGHLSDIEGIDRVVSAQCGNCRSQLTTDGFACPTCNTLIIDLANDPRSDDQVAQDALRPYPCTRCNRPVLLREIVSCDSCASQNAQALQLSLFDVIIFGMRQGEGTKSHVTQGLPHKTIEDFARTVDPNFLGGKSLRDYIADLAKPYEFEEVLKPRSLQEQATRLKLAMPAGAGGQQGGQGYQQYAGQPQQQQPQYAPAQQIQQPQQMFTGAAPLQPPQQQQMQYAPPQQQFQQPQQAGFAPQMQPQQQPQYAQQPQQAGPQPFIPIAPPNYGKQ